MGFPICPWDCPQGSKQGSLTKTGHFPSLGEKNQVSGDKEKAG